MAPWLQDEWKVTSVTTGHACDAKIVIMNNKAGHIFFTPSVMLKDVLNINQ